MKVAGNKLSLIKGLEAILNKCLNNFPWLVHWMKGLKWLDGYISKGGERWRQVCKDDEKPTIWEWKKQKWKKVEKLSCC